jgi:hypothetical protein
MLHCSLDVLEVIMDATPLDESTLARRYQFV